MYVLLTLLSCACQSEARVLRLLQGISGGDLKLAWQCTVHSADVLQTHCFLVKECWMSPISCRTYHQCTVLAAAHHLKSGNSLQALSAAPTAYSAAPAAFSAGQCTFSAAPASQVATTAAAAVSRALWPSLSSDLALPCSLGGELGSLHSHSTQMQDVGFDRRWMGASCLPEGWLAIPDPNGRCFYYNPATRQSQWDLFV